jgi:uncharacterized OB-fold protein
VAELPRDFALPAITPWNEAWFTSGTLAVQSCASCAALQHPPEEVCHACGATSFTTTVLAPRGVVHSYTVAHYAAHRSLADAVPYAVVLVALDDAPDVRVIGNLVGAEPSQARIGLPVEAVWEERVVDDGTVIRLPQWMPRATTPPR